MINLGPRTSPASIKWKSEIASAARWQLVTSTATTLPTWPSQLMRRDIEGVASDAGAVHVLYGSEDGLQITDPADQYWVEGSGDLEGTAEEHDALGEALVAGDFNGDGWDDLAIGVPGQDVDQADAAGAVHVIYGSSAGLDATDTIHDDEVWNQGGNGVAEVAETLDQFGQVLASGKFNNDGYADLAIGVWREDLESLPGGGVDAEVLHVLYGSNGGLQASDDVLGNQSDMDSSDGSEANDLFGRGLASANFGNGAFQDLAVGAYREAVGTTANAGAVSIVYGSSTGLTGTGNQTWTQNDLSANASETDDEFGRALAAADFNGNGYDDLAIGSPGEDSAAGATIVLYASSSGLTSSYSQFWTQHSANVQETAEADDQFGKGLAAADFNGDGFDDLMIGAWREDWGGATQAGAANVLHGVTGTTGLQASAPDDQLWTQDSSDVEGVVEENDRFGWQPV
jgi:hypothetical protein